MQYRDTVGSLGVVPASILAPTQQNLNLIAVGSTGASRTGQSIRLRHLDFAYQVSIDNNFVASSARTYYSTTYRLIVVWVRNCYGIQQNPCQFLAQQSSAGQAILSPFDPALVPTEAIVLYDRVGTVSGYYASPSSSIYSPTHFCRKRIYLDKLPNSTYTGTGATVADQATGQLALAIWTDLGTPNDIVFKSYSLLAYEP